MAQRNRVDGEETEIVPVRSVLRAGIPEPDEERHGRAQ
jgi:hypothetical protein